MQRERRRDPYPWTWEPAALAAAILSGGLVLGVQVGRSVANLLAGSGWTWPQSAPTKGPGPSFASPVGGAFWRSLPGVLSGDAGAGLARPRPPGLAGPDLLRASVAAIEVLIVAVLLWAAVRAYRRWGPGRLRGMATRIEAEATLGLTRLRKVRAIVRPDLYAPHPSKETTP